MTPEDVRKLVGGYATGTLTEAEQTLLFEAALEDQELFDALAVEQALKETLEQPGTRQRLIAALQTSASSQAPAARFGWLFRPVWMWGIAAAFAVAIAVAVWLPLRQPPPREIAVLTERADVPPRSIPEAVSATPPVGEPRAVRE